MISSDQRRDMMLKTPISKLIITLSIPTVITQLITLIYNTADTYFISQINKSASAAVSAVYAIMALIQAVGYGFGMGSSSLCSIRLGQKKNDEANTISSSAFYASIAFGVVLACVGILFLDPLLSVIGCSETMLPYARPYARIILLAAPIFCATFVSNTTIRSEGQTKLAMYGMIAGGIVNLVLDPVFIFLFHMETAGAALATISGQFVSFLVLFYQFKAGKTVLHLDLKRISKDFHIYVQIVTLGLPTIFRQGLSSVATAALSVQAVAYGDAAVSAMGIANKCYMLVRSVILGVGQGFQPVAGYNYGAKEYKRTKQAFWFATELGTIVGIIAAAIFFFFSNQIMWWFIQDAEVQVIGAQTLRYLCVALFFLAFSTFVNQLYQSLGFKVPATILASCRQGIFFLPIIYILPHFIGLTGVQMAQALSDLCTSAISIPFLIYMLNKILVEKPAEN